MRKGKRFLENDKLFIYVGVAIFVILAIALGVVMYMLNRTAIKIENKTGQVTQEQQNSETEQIKEEAESASTEMGKTVQEQTEATTENKNQNTTNNTTNVSNNSEKAKNNTTKNTTNTNTKTTTKKDKSTDNKTENNTNSKTTDEKSDKTESKKEVSFIKPVEGDIICEFAKDNLIYSETLKEWVTHTAIDIKADKTSVVKSSADGVVRSIINDPRYGLTVVIEHDDGYETVYSNLLTAEFVVEGEEVKQGQTIGTAGNTSVFESEMESHLHFEISKDGECIDPAILIK